ncbi:MAG: radical SAM protein [Nocardioides sp.]|nr:radical SAM protein [Nocardioides sp.]
MMSVETAASAAEQFAQQGGRELLVTGGEPFLHPDLGELVARTAEHVPVTLLTKAMVYGRGRRREALESFDSDRVTLQISLDSAGPELHDRQRGAGSHRRPLEGIQLARELDFRVRVATTYLPEDAPAAGDLHGTLADLGIAEQDRLIRPVAAEGYAEDDVEITLDSVEPEPTLTADGAWWPPSVSPTGTWEWPTHPCRSHTSSTSSETSWPSRPPPALRDVRSSAAPDSSPSPSNRGPTAPHQQDIDATAVVGVMGAAGLGRLLVDIGLLGSPLRRRRGHAFICHGRMIAWSRIADGRRRRGCGAHATTNPK